VAKTLPQTTKGVAGQSHLQDRAELAEVQAQLRELQQMVEAIRSGSIDSLIIGPPGYEQVHQTADRSYRLIVGAMNEGAATVSTGGVILGANPRLGSMTRQSVSDLIGTPVLDLIAEADRPAFDRLVDVDVGESARGEVDLRAAGGTTVPVLLAVSGFDRDGLLLRCLVLTDLTAQRAAEGQAAKAREAMREQGAFLEQAREALGLGWWASAPDDDHMITWSPQAHRIYGLIPAESAVKTETLWGIVHPDDLAAVAEARGAALAGGVRYQVEHRIIRPDGALRWVLQAAAVERDDTGAPVRLLGICQDITDRKCSEAEVRTLNAELEVRVEQRTAELELSNKNLRAFSYSIAHDLRTPLRGQQGFSEALLEEYSEILGETGRGYAGRIAAASERMGAIIDDLLRLSQVTHADMNLEPVNLSAEVTAIAGGLRSADPGRRVSFAVQEDVWVTADRILIRTVLDHLVQNAWKFTAGRKDATIEFATAAPADDAAVCCYVRDNGAGFDPAYVHKLFQPFQRLHTTREFPGTGVGLASVQRIIERHGGRAWAEGAVNDGATFYFTLGPHDSMSPRVA
jgi:PAS domain S-box-containing protein